MNVRQSNMRTLVRPNRNNLAAEYTATSRVYIRCAKIHLISHFIKLEIQRNTEHHLISIVYLIRFYITMLLIQGNTEHYGHSNWYISILMYHPSGNHSSEHYSQPLLALHFTTLHSTTRQLQGKKLQIIFC